jgi:hypothetical protein
LLAATQIWAISNKPTSNRGNRVVVCGTHGLLWIFDHRKFRGLGTIAKLSPSPTNSYGVGSHRTDVNAYPMVFSPQLQAFFQKNNNNVAIGLVLI